MSALLAVALVGFVPGWAIVRRLPLDDPLERIVLAVALSLATATAVAAVLMYAGWWSAGRAVAVLLAVTLVGLDRRRLPW